MKFPINGNLWWWWWKLFLEGIIISNCLLVHHIVIILKCKHLVVTPWKFTVLLTTLAWIMTTETTHVSSLAYLRLSKSGRTDKWPRFSSRQAVINNYLFALYFIHYGRLRAKEWKGKFSIRIWARAGRLDLCVPQSTGVWTTFFIFWMRGLCLSSILEMREGLRL